MVSLDGTGPRVEETDLSVAEDSLGVGVHELREFFEALFLEAVEDHWLVQVSLRLLDFSGESEGAGFG